MLFQEQRQREKFFEMEKRYPNVKFMPGASADNECTFLGPVNLGRDVKIRNCDVGANTYVASNSRIMNCEIGSYCSIGPDVLSGLGIHPSMRFVSTHPAFYSPNNKSPVSHVDEQRFIEFKRITIGNDVWIGARVTIIDGIKIGDGAIVACGAVVTQDVEPYSIVGGVPAKEIRKRFTEDEIEFLQKNRWWEKDIEWINANTHLFNDIKNFIKYLSEDMNGSY